MTPLLDDLPSIEYDDAVGVPNGRKTVRNDDDRAPLANSLHVLLDDALGLVIEGTGGFVEDENARVADQRSSYGDALTLASRQGRTMLTDDGVVALGQFQDEVMRTCHLGR